MLIMIIKEEKVRRTSINTTITIGRRNNKNTKRIIVIEMIR